MGILSFAPDGKKCPFTRMSDAKYNEWVDLIARMLSPAPDLFTNPVFVSYNLLGAFGSCMLSCEDDRCLALLGVLNERWGRLVPPESLAPGPKLVQSAKVVLSHAWELLLGADSVADKTSSLRDL